MADRLLPANEEARRVGRAAPEARRPPSPRADVRRAYCSATDRNVPVVLRRGERFGAVPSVRDASVLVCLDYGVRCTGAFCPLFTVPPDAPETVRELRHGTPAGPA